MADPNNPNNNQSTPTVPDQSATIQKTANDLTQMGGAANTANTAIEGLAIGVGKMGSSFDSFGNSLGNINLRPFSTQINDLQNGLANIPTGLGNITKSLGAMSQAISLVKAEGTNLLTAADNAYKFEAGILSMAGASGQMNGLLQQSGDHFVNLNSVLATYGTKMSEISQTSGVDLQAVANNWKELNVAVPGAAETMTSTLGASGQAINTLDAAMKLAAGTGRNYSDVVKDLGTAWEDYGLKGQPALEFTAKISDMANSLGINLSYTEDFMKKNADAFALVSKGAADVDKTVSRMYEAFTKGAGLSSKQSMAIIGDMTSQLAKMTTGQKAFLSAQTGGPGGLRGAYQIDMMMRNGKEDEVLQKVQDSLKKQFGGKIYTQEEASQSDYAAAQFTKQTAMLKSSAFGNLANGDDNKAARILEAFKSGTSAKNVVNEKTGADALQDSVRNGVDIQKQSNTILNQQLNELKKLTLLGSITSMDKIQKLFGNTVRQDRGGYDQISKFLDNEVGKAESRSKISNSDNNKNQKVNIGSEIDNTIGSVKSAGATISSYLPTSFRDAVQGITDKFSSGDKSQAKAGGSDLDALYKKLDANKQSLINAGKNEKGGPSQEQINHLNQIKQEQDVLNGMKQQFAGNVAKTVSLPDSATQREGFTIPAGNPKDNSNQSGPTAQMKPAPQEVVVTVNGILCDKCHNPIKTSSAHVDVATSGSHNLANQAGF